MNDVYQQARERVAALVLDADPAAEVPACPGWTVKDVVAHLAGLAGDWRHGNLAGYATEPWTAKQVADRREASIAGIVAEWADHAVAIAPHLTDPEAAGLPSYMPTIVVTDLAAHEHDLRHALGRPGARDSQAVHIGLRSQVGGLRQHFGGLGLPPLLVRADGLREWMVGRGEPVATLRGDPFDLFRATGGRRTQDEVHALDWSGDAEQFASNLLQPPFDWPAEPLGE